MPRSRASDSKESPYRSQTGMSNDYPSLWFPNMPNPAERHALFRIGKANSRDYSECWHRLPATSAYSPRVYNRIMPHLGFT